MILVEKDTNLIKHQGMVYDIRDDKIIVKDQGDNIKFIFATLNSNTVEQFDVENITGFIGNKYMYVDGEVVLNPDWVEE